MVKNGNKMVKNGNKMVRKWGRSMTSSVAGAAQVKH